MNVQATAGAARLSYYIFEGVLIGTAGGKPFHLFALSGGGGGSTRQPPSSSTNNPYMTGLKTAGRGAKHSHGGPLPVGWYSIRKPAKHPHLGRAARLVPGSAGQMLGRDGFFIHARGPHGSDGCIVPLSGFKELMDALEKSNGGTLRVEEGMGGTRFA